MIENKAEVSQDKSTSGLEKGLRALEQAKQRAANKKKNLIVISVVLW